MGGSAIAVTGLRKSFGRKEAVAGIDLEIAAGSLAGLVGPNGAGKTTLRHARPQELRRLLAPGGCLAWLLLAAARPGYRRLGRQAFGS
jgi:ABC-type phosphonate transport system ATPase subunit